MDDLFWNFTLLHPATPSTLHTTSSSHPQLLADLHNMDYEAHSPEHRIVSSAGIMVLILVSLFGNTLVCLAVYQSKNLQSNVNYFVVSLAVSDMFVGLISMPIWLVFELTKFKNLPSSISPESLIKGWTFVDIMSAVASISNLVAISFERFWSIRSPLSHRMCMSSLYVISNVFIVWIYSILVAAIHVSLWHWNWKVLFTSVVGFLVPLILIVFSYCNVYMIIQKVPRNVVSKEENQRVTRTVCILVIAFIVCWLPFFVVSISSKHCFKCHLFVLDHQWIRSVVIWLHYLNSCCNPFLYCIFNAYYKDAFKIVLKKVFLRSSRRGLFMRGPINYRRPVSNLTRSTADRSSSFHVPFLERQPDSFDDAGNRHAASPTAKSACQVELPLKEIDEYRRRHHSEPRYLTFDYKEYAERRDMERALSMSDSTDI
eukprot:gene5281-5949_t